MRLSETFSGGDAVFAGDSTVYLRKLPAGAYVNRATVKLTPVKRVETAELFVETLTFLPSAEEGELEAGAWGVTKTPPNGAALLVEVDFHARRTLGEIVGAGGTATLQVDMGGTAMSIAHDGTLKMPNDGKQNWTVVLPPTADVSGKLPGLTVAKFSLQGTNKLTVDKVRIRSVPTNVSLRLGQMPAFWVRPGELAGTNGETSLDFSGVLNAFLAGASPENGIYTIPFILHSDTIARLDVEVVIDYVLVKSALPPNLPEVTIPYSASTLPDSSGDMLTLRLPRHAIPVPGSATAQVRGEFQPTRVALGEIGREPGPYQAVVSPQCSLAQPIKATGEVAVTGLDLPLANTELGLADLHASIMEDADGKPSGKALASAPVRVGKPLPAQSVWNSVTLPNPLRVEAGRRYWIVLQSLRGEVCWSAGAGTAGELPLHATFDGGLSWQVATVPEAPGSVMAQFRLRHIPDRFRVPIQLEIGQGNAAVRRTLGEFDSLGRVEFSFDFAGELTEHLKELRKPEIAPADGDGELLVNDNFEQPPLDDATERLFGAGMLQRRRSGSTDPLSGTVDLSRHVDLSVERFITLSDDQGLPVRIDCAGANPSRTSLEEVVSAINEACPNAPASIAEEKYVSIAGSSVSPLYSWLKPEVPAGWQGGPGGVLRGRDARTGGLFVELGDGPTELSQRVAVRAGRSYLLQTAFEESSSSNSGLTGKPTVLEWQIAWLGANGQLLNTSRETVKLNCEPDMNKGGRLLWPQPAPPGAIEAEIRFIQRSLGPLRLYGASFAPTGEVILNGCFDLWCNQVPLAWTQIGGKVNRGKSGVELGGDEKEPTTLTQTVAVVEKETYELRVAAYPQPPLTGDPEAQAAQKRARLELTRLGNGGPIGTTVILPLDGRDFPTHVWSGAAPAGVTQAKVRLVQPQVAGKLVVESVSLSRADLVDVPLIFLAEAPGQLTVSDLRVAYDLPEPPAPL